MEGLVIVGSVVAFLAGLALLWCRDRIEELEQRIEGLEREKLQRAVDQRNEQNWKEVRGVEKDF